MVLVLDILASLLILGAAVMVVTKMLQFAWRVLVAEDQTLMVLVVLVVVTLVRVVRLAVVKVVAVVNHKPTIMVDRQVVTAQHLKVIVMADQ